MAEPAPDALASVAPQRSPFAGRPPAERRDRRKAVESMMLAGASTWQVLAVMSRRFKVSPRTIRADVGLVERRWAQDAARDLDRNRTAVVRRLSRVARKAERAGDWAAATSANVALGRFLGLAVRAQLDVLATGRGRVVHEHRIADPSTWLPQFLECAGEVGLLSPGSTVAVLAQALPAQAAQGPTGGDAPGGSE